MPTVTAGSDTYGRVKTVGGTAVVTKFAMVSFVPLFPLESFYTIGPGRTEKIWVPFVFSASMATVLGFPLGRLDRLSVLMTYVRLGLGILTAVGFLVLVVIVVSRLAGGPADESAAETARAALAAFLAGLGGGGLSYLLPPRPDDREIEIRTRCGEVLGVCADPAAVRRDVAVEIGRELDREFAPSSGDVWIRGAEAARELVRARLQIALGESPEANERRTDDLLDRLRI